MITKIFIEQAFERLKENIGEEVSITTYNDGKLKYIDGFIYDVMDYRGIQIGGTNEMYVPFVSVRTGILLIKLKSNNKILYKNSSLIDIDYNLTNEDWYIEAIRVTYGDDYLKAFSKERKKQKEEGKIRSKIFKKRETNSFFTQEEIDVIDKMELEDSIKHVKEEIDKNSSSIIPMSIKNKLYDTGILYVRGDRHQEWCLFVDELFICGECITAIKATIEILKLASVYKNSIEEVINKNVYEKYGFLPNSIKYTIMNALIYFSIYGNEIRKNALFRVEQLEEENPKQM